MEFPSVDEWSRGDANVDLVSRSLHGDSAASACPPAEERTRGSVCGELVAFGMTTAGEE